MITDSSVGIATGYGLDDQGSILGKDTFFLFSTASRPALGPTQPLIQWAQGALSRGVKRKERESGHSPPASDEVSDHLPPANDEVKNGGAIPPLAHMPSWRSA
jgi:hypothetical protein